MFGSASLNKNVSRIRERERERERERFKTLLFKIKLCGRIIIKPFCLMLINI
jgi:hypothetical protein